MRTEISLIIPSFNEEDGIVNVIEFAKKIFNQNNYNYEIIVVDDGSIDKTKELAVLHGARVVSHPHNIGYGRSLKDGIIAAKFDTIVISDSDGTYPLDHLPILINEYQKGFDMIVGQRTGKAYKESYLKMPLRIFLKFIVEFTTGREIPDINSGFRVFSKNKILKYLNELCDTFSFTTGLTLAYMMTGLFVSYVKIPYHNRIGKTKVKLFRDSLRTLQFIVHAIVYYNPIKIFLVVLSPVLFISILLFILFIIFQNTLLLSISIIGFFVVMLLFGMGLIAEQLRAGRSKI